MCNKNKFLCSLLHFVGRIPCSFHEKKYIYPIYNEYGQTLIFRNSPPWSELFLGILIFLVGITFSFIMLKKIGERIFVIFLISIIGGLTFIVHFLYNWYRIRKPIIILDQQGIWCEGWGRDILWSDIHSVQCIKQKLSHKSYHLGFSWIINVHTEQKIWKIYEGRWNFFLPGRIRDPFEEEGGQLGKLIKQYYKKSQQNTTSHQLMGHSDPTTIDIPTQSILHTSTSCCICMELFEEVIIERLYLNPCGHDICEICALEWFFPNNILDQQKPCPTCRSTIDFDVLCDDLGL